MSLCDSNTPFRSIKTNFTLVDDLAKSCIWNLMFSLIFMIFMIFSAILRSLIDLLQRCSNQYGPTRPLPGEKNIRHKGCDQWSWVGQGIGVRCWYLHSLDISNTRVPPRGIPWRWPQGTSQGFNIQRVKHKLNRGLPLHVLQLCAHNSTMKLECLLFLVFVSVCMFCQICIEMCPNYPGFFWNLRFVQSVLWDTKLQKKSECFATAQQNAKIIGASISLPDTDSDDGWSPKVELNMKFFALHTWYCRSWWNVDEWWKLRYRIQYILLLYHSLLQIHSYIFTVYIIIIV